MNVITQQINPPIAVRGLDWCSHLESYEPGDLSAMEQRKLKLLAI